MKVVTDVSIVRINCGSSLEKGILVCGLRSTGQLDLISDDRYHFKSVSLFKLKYNSYVLATWFTLYNTQHSGTILAIRVSFHLLLTDTLRKNPSLGSICYFLQRLSFQQYRHTSNSPVTHHDSTRHACWAICDPKPLRQFSDWMSIAVVI